MNWNPPEFHKWYSNIDDVERKLRAWDGLSAAQRKSYLEWRAFTKFARVSPLDIDPRTIESREPQEPDILCQISAQSQYFELGEVTDQGLAKQAGDAAKQKQDIYGGMYSQLEPLCRIFNQKCGKSYATNGLPVSLLLHYAVSHQVPHLELVADAISKSRDAIITKLKASPFNAVWLYDEWSGKVIDSVQR